MTDSIPRPLRVVGDDSNPLTRDELQTRGNELLLKASRAARDALRASTQLEIIYRPRSYDLYEVRKLRAQADEAVRAWTAVAGTLGELLNEWDKSNRLGGGA